MLAKKLSITVSRHTIVCCVAQEAGVPHRGYIDRKKENVIFTLLYLSDPLSDWNQICYRVAHQPGESTFKIGRKSLWPFLRYELTTFDSFLRFFLSSSCYGTLTKIAITANTYSDRLKMWHTERESKGESGIKFGTNPMNGSGFITDYSRKTRSICCHAYRVNRFMK